MDKIRHCEQAIHELDAPTQPTYPLGRQTHGRHIWTETFEALTDHIEERSGARLEDCGPEWPFKMHTDL